MIRAASVAAVSMAFVASVNAQAPPIEFKGVHIGAPVASLMQAMPAIECTQTGCSIWPEDRADRFCRTTRAIGSGKLLPPHLSNLGIGERDMDCFRQTIRDSYFGGTLPKSYAVTLREGLVDSVYIRLDANHFHRIAAGLIEKYGTPSRDETITVQNRMGAAFDDRTVEWDRPDGQISARQRAGAIDVSTVQMSSAASASASREAAKNQPKATAKQL